MRTGRALSSFEADIIQLFPAWVRANAHALVFVMIDELNTFRIFVQELQVRGSGAATFVGTENRRPMINRTCLYTCTQMCSTHGMVWLQTGSEPSAQVRSQTYLSHNTSLLRLCVISSKWPQVRRSLERVVGKNLQFVPRFVCELLSFIIEVVGFTF